MIEITIPKKTPTVNHLYWHRGNIKILTKEARELRDFISRTVRLTKPDCFEFAEKKLIVQVDIYENWFTKKGLVAKKDISNREKFLIDSVFKALDMDDKFIFIHGLRKVQSESEEKAVIKIDYLK